MRESDYYPAGAYNDPNAPYNEVSITEIEVEATVCTSLSKPVKLTTDVYEFNDEGDVNYDSIALTQLYNDSEFSIPELLEILGREASIKIAELKRTNRYSPELHKWEKIRDSCSGWNEDEMEVVY